MQLTEKYRPKTSYDVISHKMQLDDLKKKIQGYNSGKKKALLIYGPPGVGKTSSIHALANELDLEIIEVNASDVRNTEGLEQKVLPAIRQQSLFGKGKIILIDEIDGLSGNADRGGINSIAKFIDESKFPIVLTANDVWDQKFNAIRKLCQMIEYKALNFLDIANHLKKICEKEGIKFDDDAITHLARNAQGDLRSALNDLQNFSSGNMITKKDVENISEREREETIINALLKVFKTTNPEVALPAFDNIDEDIDKIFLWLDENLPKEYTKVSDLANAYENMSLADVYFGRIRRWQYYRYYVYIYNLLSAGVALSKKDKNPSFIQYGPTTRILKIWMANNKNLRKKSISEKIASKTHQSKKRVYENIAYIKRIAKKNIEKFTEDYHLEPEEVEWLKT